MKRWDDLLARNLRQRAQPSGLQVLVRCDRLGIDYQFNSGPASQPFHTASIGKLFTAVMIGRLADAGRLALTDPISRYLPASELKELFVVKGADYAAAVTIEQLLGHTSGIADYFDGPVRSGPLFSRLILTEPDELWTPEKLLDFTRLNQAAVGRPGQRFVYSDTGYILLGLLVVAVTGRSLSQNFQEHFFTPLNMADTYLLYDQEPGQITRKTSGRPPLERIWFNGREISTFRSLSCDWAGGGIVSTTTDLLTFSQALWSGQLLSPATLENLAASRRSFRPGLRYGLGIMTVYFEEFSFLLRGRPRLQGHIGVLATHLFYDPVHDAHIVMNFGDNRQMVQSFKVLIAIVNALHRQG